MSAYEKIIKDRGIVETLVLGTMLKSLTLFSEYKISENDFIIDKVKFFFSLGRTMSKTHSELDEASVAKFVSSNKLKSEYEKYGGWNSLSSAMEYGKETNISAYIDDLAKNNLLIALDKRGFNITKEMDHNELKFIPFELFQSMSCREVEEFYEGLISSCSVNSIKNNMKVENLLLTKEDREKLKEKTEAGTPYNIMFEYNEKEIGLSDNEELKYIYSLPVLSNRTNGLGKGGGINIISGFSGIGKTTLLFFNYILSMIYQGEKVVIFANEQKSQYFKSMLVSFIAYNIFNYHDLDRNKIDNGDFTDFEEELMEKIEAFLKNRGFEESLKFIYMEEFGIYEILRKSKELVAHEGFTVIAVDTFKSENSSDTNYTGRLIENSKLLDNFGNKYNVITLLSMQLVTAQENKSSYLSASDLAEAKAVKNVCGLLMLMRKVVNDLELDSTNKKFFLKPYRLKYNKLKKTTEREYIQFDIKDLQKEYRLLFLNKSRRGQDGDVILLRFYGKTGRFEEIGRCEKVYRGQLSY
ncbi:DnaB-like helicase C-terminal domain-containing protein [Clostridioides difficile]|nr:DnaB-like helicase C-terminal domain-containing protein [Clostridioides difficile]